MSSLDDLADCIDRAADALTQARSAAQTAIGTTRDARAAAAGLGAGHVTLTLDDVDTALHGVADDAAACTGALRILRERLDGVRSGAPLPGSPTAGARIGPRLESPGNHRGSLGRAYSPGVHDDQGRFTAKELATAEWLAARRPGACIHPRVRDPGEETSSPDAMVRTSPGDPGTVTEFKTLISDASRAVKDNMRTATRQLVPHGNGEVVIDGRSVALTEAAAREGHARFVGERRKHDRPLPLRVTVILGDGRELTWRADG